MVVVVFREQKLRAESCRVSLARNGFVNEREFPRGIRFLRVSSSVLVGALFR